uniref:Uncharacterized protein n=1 Tax=Fagus sylvatica TaxID=28930 RepID=A0A2N9G9L4_FAGSY
MLSVGFSGSGGKELSFQTTLNVLFCGLDFYAFVYEKNPKIKEAITLKYMEYLRRAEEIRAILDNKEVGLASVVMQQLLANKRQKWKGGEGKDAEDPEQAKLRAGLDYVIIREKPNVKCSNVVGLESAK